jgi:hypothetical protein
MKSKITQRKFKADKLRSCPMCKPYKHGREGTPGRPRCHSVVTNGMISFCADSTHALAGQTVRLEDF